MRFCCQMKNSWECYDFETDMTLSVWQMVKHLSWLIYISINLQYLQMDGEKKKTLKLCLEYRVHCACFISQSLKQKEKGEEIFQF